MKIALTTESNRERLMVPICEFSFAAYSVQIKQDFRCFLDVPGSQTKSHHLQRPGLIQRISQWLQRTYRQPTSVPVSKSSMSPVSKSAGHREERISADLGT